MSNCPHGLDWNGCAICQSDIAKQDGLNAARARVAHRLATTPAPEVDPDAGAKKVCAIYWRARSPNQYAGWSDQGIWDHHKTQHDAWRAVAAMKESGGE